MQYSFSYNKKQVIQGLRYHFISRTEVRFLVIVVNVFAIIAAVLYFMKKIRPEPFLLGSFLWVMIMLTFWQILPLLIYRREATFKESFTIYFAEHDVRLESSRGYVDWNYSQFSSFFESPNFFHLYFNPRSFFLIPKEGMTEEFKHDLRGVLNRKIGKK
ncbi:YcxB family protein [Danxiaibacter flavus]|uniref:YcxB family protein n=1 Tax=Danxiaibacter flavus TaxID=3049108 RepID=A0ABV3ZJS7_9BACT|nr:YcxB family protein [Chitinophagaceae bacterium DXS]